MKQGKDSSTDGLQQTEVKNVRNKEETVKRADSNGKEQTVMA